jgi:hypothetical protein
MDAHRKKDGAADVAVASAEDPQQQVDWAALDGEVTAAIDLIAQTEASVSAARRRANELCPAPAEHLLQPSDGSSKFPSWGLEPIRDVSGAAGERISGAPLMFTGHYLHGLVRSWQDELDTAIAHKKARGPAQNALSAAKAYLADYDRYEARRDEACQAANLDKAIGAHRDAAYAFEPLFIRAFDQEADCLTGLRVQAKTLQAASRLKVGNAPNWVRTFAPRLASSLLLVVTEGGR